jgi:two-component system OmpR family response regulator
MLAVIQSLIRRSTKSEKKDDAIFSYNLDKNSIFFKHTQLNLTHAEYEVLISLLKNKNAIVSKDQIVDECTSLSRSNNKSLEVIISRLRTKLNDDSKNPTYLKSFRGLGYKIIQ